MKTKIYMIEVKNEKGIYEPVGMGTMKAALEYYWKNPGKACRCRLLFKERIRELTK